MNLKNYCRNLAGEKGSKKINLIVALNIKYTKVDTRPLITMIIKHKKYHFHKWLEITHQFSPLKWVVIFLMCPCLKRRKKEKKRKVFTLQIVWLKVAVQRCMLVIKRMTYWYELFMVMCKASKFSSNVTYVKNIIFWFWLNSFQRSNFKKANNYQMKWKMFILH